LLSGLDRLSVTSKVRSLVTPLLDTRAVDDNVQLMDQGLDSLGATEVSSRLSNEFELRLSPTVVFSYPTINDLAVHICDLLGLHESKEEDHNVPIEPFPVPLDLALPSVSNHQDGDILHDNPWFSAYLTHSPRSSFFTLRIYISAVDFVLLYALVKLKCRLSGFDLLKY
jgi:acyl carrier protein